MRALLCVFAVLASGWSDAAGQERALPPQVAAVQKYILEDEYPELFGDKSYRVKIENAVVADLDRDGEMEVILHVVPHYRQSPTIAIYRVDASMTVTRVVEGLAPGPLQSLTDAYLDSHTLGEGVDMDLGDRQHDLSSRRQIVSSSLGQFLSIVEYANFFHVDSRKGNGAYIDMAGVSQPKSKTCEGFEFSAVDGISVGVVSGAGDAVLLAAWVKDKVYLYRIKAFTPSGLIDKEIWSVDVAEDFKGFPEGPGPRLEYLTAAGAAKRFTVECVGNRCRQVGA